MSAIGPKRTSLVAAHGSAFGGKADITTAARRTLPMWFGVITKPATEDEYDLHDLCSCRGCRLFALQPVCGGGRRGSLVRRDQRWRVLGLPVSLIGRLSA